MPKLISKHTLESANESLKEKGVDSFLKVIEINDESDTIIVNDNVYGNYVTIKKSLCAVTKFPLHKKRAFQERLEKAKQKHIGKKIKGHLITNLFYGPDIGYKNRSFILEVMAECGHTCLTTSSILTKHKKTLFCQKCSHVTNGERTTINGIRKIRTSTYAYWANHNSKFPEKYKDYPTFLRDAGEKPRKSKLDFIDGKPVWSSLKIENEEDKELALIATSVRQIFRYSKYYKDAIEKSRVETEEGSRYRCNKCKKLFRISHIQVDHINPIKPLDGSPLNKDTLLDVIWTDKIQILDKACHQEKSTYENKVRKENRTKS
jgi:hypothetical protein